MRGVRRSLFPVAAVVFAACSGGGDAPDTVADAPSTTLTVDDPLFDPVVDPLSDTVAAATTTTEPPAPVRVGLVAPSAADDGSFTQSMADALARLGVEVEVAGDTDPDDAAGALERFAGEGFDLVVAHGAEYAGAVREAAGAAPDAAFAWGPADASGPDDPPNLFVYGARADEGAYALGAMAAAITGGAPLGVVGSVEVADVRRYVEGFVAGAGDTSVEVTYIDSFDDEALGAEAARIVADRGAATLTATSQMSVGVLAVAVERSLPWFANLVDQSALAPDLVVASQVYRWEVAIEAILAAAAGEDRPAGSFDLTLANGGLEVVYNDAFALDPAIREIGDAALGGVRDGSVATGVG
ncbi:MAG: BMP family lipoprotein [Ilumatobacteraceae bacterium]